MLVEVDDMFAQGIDVLIVDNKAKVLYDVSHAEMQLLDLHQDTIRTFEYN